MSEVAASKQPAQRRWTPGATLWFMWMVGMWIAFYILLVADKLEGLWSAIRDLPLLIEIVLWLPFFPWRCGSGAGIGERTACEAGAARAANPGPDPVLATDSLVVARLPAKPAGTIAGAPPTIPERGRPAHARRTRARGQWSRVSLARTGSQSSVAATSSSTTISTRSLRSPRSSPRPRHQWPM